MPEKFIEVIGETWKSIDLGEYAPENYKMEVSDLGRVRTTTKRFGQRILKGDLVSGYRIIRMKLYKPRTEESQNTIDEFTKEIETLKIKAEYLETQGTASEFNEVQGELEKLIQKKKKFVRKETLARTISYHSLVHRMVVDNFLPPPEIKDMVVAHLDYNKLNNKVSNLKWMTKEENVEHQKHSHYVIDYKRKLKKRKNPPKNAKVTETRVMYLKKLLNEGKSMKHLVRMFKVTETQILRIKRGENWGHVEAAK